MTDDELTAALSAARSEINALTWRLDELEGRTALTNSSFVKRAFAVWGHYFVASLMIALPFYAVIFIIYLLGTAASSR